MLNLFPDLFPKKLKNKHFVQEMILKIYLNTLREWFS